MEYNYTKQWKQQEQRALQKEYCKRTMFQVFIPDKEYGDYWTWLNVIGYRVKAKYSSWTHWKREWVEGKVYQVDPAYFTAEITERMNIRKYLVAKFIYYFREKKTRIIPFYKPANPELPILPKNEEIPLNVGKWCNNASPELNKDIIMIESSNHQLKGSYNRTLGRSLSGNGKLTREDLKHPVFNNDPVFQIIRDYKPLWNLYCNGIDKKFKYYPKINKEDNTDRRGGLNCNDLTVGGNINYYPDGLEKLPKRTSSDLTFYRRFIPYYVDNYLGRNINTRREYKIALYLYTVLNYYSSALDKEGWYGKLFPRHKYKGEEGKTLRKEVRDWLKANR